MVLTDRDTRPAETNLALNRQNLVGKIAISKLEWGSNVTHSKPPFDIILAADVVYIEETFSELIKTLEDLSDSHSVILLSCKRRYERHDRFFKRLLDTRKFTKEVVRTWQEKEDVAVHKLRRNAVT